MVNTLLDDQKVLVGRNDLKWIQEGLKIKFLGIERNHCHCVEPIPAIFFFPENGHRMQKLSRFEDQVKQTKKVKFKVNISKSTLMSTIRHDDVMLTSTCHVAAPGVDTCQSFLAF
jgi:hypothetical protein